MNENNTEEVALSQEGNTEVSVDSNETTEVTNENTENTTDSSSKDEKTVDYRGKLNATNRFLESQGYKFKDGKWVPPSKEASVSNQNSDNLSVRDAMILVRENVADEDVDTVVKWAKLNNQTLPEALKDPVMHTVLKTRTEQRKTAAATNTGTARRSSVKLTDEEIVEKAMRGELPEDPSVLVKAQLNLKRKKNK